MLDLVFEQPREGANNKIGLPLLTEALHRAKDPVKIRSALRGLVKHAGINNRRRQGRSRPSS